MKNLTPIRIIHVDAPVLVANAQVFVLRYDDFIGWHGVFGSGRSRDCQQIIPSFALVEFIARHSLVCADVNVDTDAELAAYEAARPVVKSAPVVYETCYYGAHY